MGGGMAASWWRIGVGVVRYMGRAPWVACLRALSRCERAELTLLGISQDLCIWASPGHQASAP